MRQQLEWILKKLSMGYVENPTSIVIFVLGVHICLFMLKIYRYVIK